MSDINQKPLDEHVEREVEKLRGGNGIAASELEATQEDAARALEGQALDFTPEEEKKLVRKQDRILLPLMLFSAGMSLVDKVAIGSAATLTMRSDLHLVGSEYSWAVSIYFFGLLVGAYPSNYLLQKYHTGRIVGTACAVWGLVLLGTMGIQNFSQLAALRFLLGLFEAAMPPAFTMTTGRFYTQPEQPFRFSIWGLGSTCFPAPFLLVFYGIGQAQGSLASWRYIFCFLGLLSFIIGCILFFVIPDKPSTCTWLNSRERALAVHRIAKYQTGIKNSVFKKEQLKEALLDIKVWLVALMWAFQQSGTVIPNNFQGIIIKRFGFSGLDALLLQIPNWVMGGIGTIFVGVLCSHKRFLRLKTLVLACNAAIVITSGAMLYSFHGDTKKDEAIGLAFCAIIGLNSAGYPVILTLIGQNFAGTTKRQAAMTIAYTLYCLSNLSVPQSFLNSQAPTYTNGLITVVILQCLFLISCLIFFVIVRRENRRRDGLGPHAEPIDHEWLKTRGQGGETGVEDEADRAARYHDAILEGLADETDKQNLRFRYYS